MIEPLAKFWYCPSTENKHFYQCWFKERKGKIESYKEKDLLFYEDQENVFLYIDAPGLKSEEIEIKTNGNNDCLIISFKRKPLHNKLNFDFPITQYIIGKFITSPPNNFHNYTATQWNYESGVIILKIPFYKENNKKIPISNIRISENV